MHDQNSQGSANGTTSREAMLSRIRKLLAQADNVVGTPEAEAFEAKAFALLAEHGIAESEARAHQEQGTGQDVVEALTFNHAGRYPRQQQRLLIEIALALHCTVTTKSSDPTYSKLWGVKLHTDRVRALFGILNPRMAAGVMDAVQPPFSYESTKAFRISWMTGYAASIGNRLERAEKEAADARDTATASTSTALVLISDRDRAIAARDKAIPNLRKASYKPRVTSDGYYQGREAGNRVDLDGGRKLRGPKPALSGQAGGS